MSQDKHAQNLPAVLEFEGTNLQIIDHNGKPWITAADLSRALGYKHADQVTKIFDRRAHEFSEEMSLTVNLAVRGSVAAKPVRIFSPRGAHLIAMFARTAKAEAFRRWVLDVLEGFDRPAPERQIDGPEFLQRAQAFAKQNLMALLEGERFVAAVVDGRLSLQPITPRTVVVEPEGLAALVGDMSRGVHIRQLPGIIAAASERLDAAFTREAEEGDDV